MNSFPFSSWVFLIALLFDSASSAYLSPDEIARQQALEQKQMARQPGGPPQVNAPQFELPYIEGLIYRQTKGIEDCMPGFACKGVNIFEIPYMFEHVHSSFVNPRENNLFDTKKSQKCMANKRILVLGDSVLEEWILDAATLLSGIALNQNDFDAFIHESAQKSPKRLLHKLPNGVTVYHHNNRRNMTIVSDVSDTYIRHRFTGHVDIKGNYYGMRTLNDPGFVQNELLCLLGLVGDDVACPMPDIILMNGGHHDVQADTGGLCNPECLDLFTSEMRKFFSFLRQSYQQKQNMNVKVYWKGTLLTARDLANGRKNKGSLFLLDQRAQMICREFGVPYVNASDVLTYLPRFNANPSLYTKDRIHHGAIARGHDLQKSGSVSMLVTQRVLYSMCPSPQDGSVPQVNGIAVGPIEGIRQPPQQSVVPQQQQQQQQMQGDNYLNGGTNSGQAFLGNDLSMNSATMNTGAVNNGVNRDAFSNNGALSQGFGSSGNGDAYSGGPQENNQFGQGQSRGGIMNRDQYNDGSSEQENGFQGGRPSRSAGFGSETMNGPPGGMTGFQQQPQQPQPQYSMRGSNDYDRMPRQQFQEQFGGQSAQSQEGSADGPSKLQKGNFGSFSAPVDEGNDEGESSKFKKGNFGSFSAPVSVPVDEGNDEGESSKFKKGNFGSFSAPVSAPVDEGNDEGESSKFKKGNFGSFSAPVEEKNDDEKSSYTSNGQSNGGERGNTKFNSKQNGDEDAGLASSNFHSTPSAPKSYTAQMESKLARTNSELEANPSLLNDQIDKNSEFAEIERRRCSSGNCKPGYLVGSADAPQESRVEIDRSSLSPEQGFQTGDGDGSSRKGRRAPRGDSNSDSEGPSQNADPPRNADSVQSDGVTAIGHRGRRQRRDDDSRHMGFGSRGGHHMLGMGGPGAMVDGGRGGRLRQGGF